MGNRLNWNKARQRDLGRSAPSRSALGDLDFVRPKNSARPRKQAPHVKPTMQLYWHLRDGRCVHWNAVIHDPALEAQLVHRQKFDEQRRALKAGKLKLGRL